MAAREELIKKIEASLPQDAGCRDDSFKTGVIFAARTPLGKLREVMKLGEASGYYLESITALDFQDTFELVYHLNCYEPSSRISLRVLCGHDQSPPTVSDIFASALWQEREVSEFFGIRFADHPDLRPLLLPEDADFTPLRKTFGVVHAYHKREEIYG